MYKHLTQAQRYYIYVERQKGSTQKSIAETIGVSAWAKPMNLDLVKAGSGREAIRAVVPFHFFDVPPYCLQRLFSVRK